MGEGRLGEGRVWEKRWCGIGDSGGGTGWPHVGGGHGEGRRAWRQRGGIGQVG